jgi:hypothetical protein
VAKQNRKVWRPEWERRVREWRRSGISLKAFAAREGYVYGTLRHWMRILRESAEPSHAIVPAPLTFVELKAAAVPPIEIVVDNRRVVRVPAAFDEEELVRVLRVVERRQ